MPSDSRRIAVLIDGDNAYLKYLERVVAEVGRHGIVAIRHIYGGHAVLDSWAECIRLHGFTPVCVEGKNAADISLTIDAMDMLRYKTADDFCIVTSDNDFAELVRRLRKEGAFVTGIGASDKEISPLEDACNAFAHFEDLPPPADPDPAIQEIVRGWKEAVRKAIHTCAPGGGWVNMASVGNMLKHDPGLDYGTYCHGGLKSLVGSCPGEFETRGGEVRLRPGSAA